jgi:GNAT superfamily N-acetyltransferase
MCHYPQPKSREQALAWIAWNQRLYREHGFGLWLLTLRATGEFVGDCGLTPQQVDGVTEIEVGYHVRGALQGRGLATEAAAVCRDYARDVLGVDRLIAIIALDNRPSQRVAEKLGLVLERHTDNQAAGPAPSASMPPPQGSAERRMALDRRHGGLGRVGTFQRPLREVAVGLSDFRSRTHPEFGPAGASRCHSLPLAGQAILGSDLREWLFLLVTA